MAADIAGKWALVTGASSGLGVEFATLLADRRANLVLVARSGARLQELADRVSARRGIRTTIEAMDLSVLGAGTALKRRLDSRGIHVDILVCNAGYGVYGSLVDQPLERTLSMLQLNIVTLTELTQLFSKDMVQRRSGHILLVASLLGFQPVPGYAAYAASKAYVLHFGEALFEELKPHGVTVTVLSPGVTTTGFAAVASQPDTSMLRLLMMEPRPVAQLGIAALLQRRPSVIAGAWNNLIALSNRVAPRRLQRLIMQRVFAGG
ncbi:MAG: SDR family NAD(P)-dependent oxidoreductase [Gemmatimonadota bacterium]